MNLMKHYKKWCFVTALFFASVFTLPMLFEGDVLSVLQLATIALYICFVIVVKELQ